MRPYVAAPGTSAAVTTARTPAMAVAALVSTETMRACGCGERRIAAQSSPSAHRSEAYGKVPSVFALASACGSEVPRPCAAGFLTQGPGGVQDRDRGNGGDRVAHAMPPSCGWGIWCGTRGSSAASDAVAAALASRSDTTSRTASRTPR